MSAKSTEAEELMTTTHSGLIKVGVFAEFRTTRE